MISFDNYTCDGQMSFEDILMEPVKVNKKIRLIELFAGVGSQAMALRNIGADFEHYRMVEIDKYAVASYNAIHGTFFETSDISKLGGGGSRNKRYGYLYLHNDIFLPLPGFIGCRKDARYGKRIWNTVIAVV